MKHEGGIALIWAHMNACRGDDIYRCHYEYKFVYSLQYKYVILTEKMTHSLIKIGRREMCNDKEEKSENYDQVGPLS